MKRSGPSQDEFQVLRKRHSSMFSISTVLEEDEDGEAPDGEVPVKAVISLASTAKSLSSSSPTTTDSTEETSSSSCTDENDGLFFFDDDVVEQGRTSVSSSHAGSFLPNAATTTTATGRSYRTPSPVLLGTTLAVGFEPKLETGRNDAADWKTGLVFETGSLHYDRHNRLHKERPIRITSILEALKNSPDDLYDRCCVVDSSSSPSAERFLDDDDYLRVHLPGYMKRMNRLSSSCSCCDDEKLDREAQQYQSIFLTQDSVAEAKKAAASLCSLVANVVEGSLDNGFAVIRPPGHHAEPGLAGGYCLLNNIAIAAAFARAQLGVGKVLIVDWDVHHGNGTQSIFLDNPNVLYFSVHRWQGGNFYPFSPNGGPSYVGTGDGAGFNINVGWSRKGMTDDEYFAVWDRILMPVAREYEPDLVLVSAGFDAAHGDMGECHVTPEGFARLTRSLMTLADGRVVCALEGGYVRSVLGKCVKSVVQTLLDCNSPKVSQAEEIEASEGGDVLKYIDQTAAENIRSTVDNHAKYWKFLSRD